MEHQAQEEHQLGGRSGPPDGHLRRHGAGADQRHQERAGATPGHRRPQRHHGRRMHAEWAGAVRGLGNLGQPGADERSDHRELEKTQWRGNAHYRTVGESVRRDVLRTQDTGPPDGPGNASHRSSGRPGRWTRRPWSRPYRSAAHPSRPPEDP